MMIRMSMRIEEFLKEFLPTWDGAISRILPITRDVDYGVL